MIIIKHPETGETLLSMNIDRNAGKFTIQSLGKEFTGKIIKHEYDDGQYDEYFCADAGVMHVEVYTTNIGGRIDDTLIYYHDPDDFGRWLDLFGVSYRLRCHHGECDCCGGYSVYEYKFRNNEEIYFDDHLGGSNAPSTIEDLLIFIKGKL